MTLGGGTRRDTLDVPPLGTLPPAPAPLHGSKPVVSSLLRDLALRLRFERRVAADPEELAAFLEEAGYTDELLRRHDLGGVFDAAEQLYALKRGKRRLGRPAALGEAALPWKVLWRGPLLLIIVLSALGVERALGVPEARSALAAAGVVAWGLGGRLLWLRQAVSLHPAALRPRLWSGTLLSGVTGGLLTAALGQDWGLGLLVGSLGGLALTSAGVMLALGRWRMVLQVYGSVALLSPLVWWLSVGASAVWSTLAASGWLLAWALLAWSAAWRVTSGAQGAAQAAPQASLQIAADLLVRDRPAWVQTLYGWASALAFAVLASRLELEVLLTPLLLFGGLELLARLTQRRLRQLAQRTADPAVLARSAVWPVLGAPLLLFLGLGALGLLSGAALAHSLGAALLSAAFLQSSWLSRQAALLPALTLLWLVCAGMLAFTFVSWWLPILLLALTVLLMCDEALRDLSVYR